MAKASLHAGVITGPKLVVIFSATTKPLKNIGVTNQRFY
jgi:hypothetical protein